MGGAGAAAGVLAGGMLTSWLGWRSVFLVNVPVGLAAGLLALHMVPRSGSASRFGRGLDLPGAALAVAGLVTVVSAFAGAPAHGWASARTLLLLALALVLLAAVAAAGTPAPRPPLPPHNLFPRAHRAAVPGVAGAPPVAVRPHVPPPR